MSDSVSGVRRAHAVRGPRPSRCDGDGHCRRRRTGRDPAARPASDERIRIASRRRSSASGRRHHRRVRQRRGFFETRGGRRGIAEILRRSAIPARRRAGDTLPPVRTSTHDRRPRPRRGRRASARRDRAAAAAARSCRARRAARCARRRAAIARTSAPDGSGSAPCRAPAPRRAPATPSRSRRRRCAMATAAPAATVARWRRMKRGAR